MRGFWTLGVALAGAAGLVVMAIGGVYLGVRAGSLPDVLGKVPGSRSHLTERGLFSVMIGGLLMLVAISLRQFQPGGALAFGNGGETEQPAAGTAETGADPAGAAEAGRAAAADADRQGAAEHERVEAEEYIGLMGDDVDTDRIMDREARRREERRAVEEAGGGESEGFELAEAALIEHASHGDDHRPSKIMRDAVGPDEEQVDVVNGEADEEHLPD